MSRWSIGVPRAVLRKQIAEQAAWIRELRQLVADLRAEAASNPPADGTNPGTNRRASWVDTVNFDNRNRVCSCADCLTCGCGTWEMHHSPDEIED